VRGIWVYDFADHFDHIDFLDIGAFCRFDQSVILCLSVVLLLLDLEFIHGYGIHQKLLFSIFFSRFIIVPLQLGSKAPDQSGPRVLLSGKLTWN
jgi:hypothetical protein